VPPNDDREPPAYVAGIRVCTRLPSVRIRAGVRYKQPKGGRGRTVALSARVVNERRSHRAQQAQELKMPGISLTDDAFVVAQADGRPLHREPSPINGICCSRSMRRCHAFASTICAMPTRPTCQPPASTPKNASERLGHSKVGITLDLYSHVLPEMQEAAAARVDRDLEDVINRRTKAIG
jgi:integrase